jgi:biopolymer transport protein ExbD
MRLASRQTRQPPENTIPLINVVFLMLIFFLFAGSIAKDDARRIEPPLNILEDETIRSTGALIVAADGLTYSGEEEVSVAGWLAAQTQSGTGATNDPVRVAADGTLQADLLEQVLKQFQDAGRGDIVLITRRSAK